MTDICGAGAYKFTTIGNEKWMSYKFPTIGKDRMALAHGFMMRASKKVI